MPNSVKFAMASVCVAQNLLLEAARMGMDLTEFVSRLTHTLRDGTDWHPVGRIKIAGELLRPALVVKHPDQPFPDGNRT